MIAMALDFTNIKDHPGSAIYIIHSRLQTDKQKFERLAADLGAKTKKQIILMSSDDQAAREIVKFYQLRGANFVIIVRDDDQLHKVWSDGERFDAAQIAYTSEQAG